MTLLLPLPGRYLLYHEEGVFDVLENREDRDQVEVLEYETEVVSPEGRALASVKAQDIGARDLQGPATGLVEAPDEVEEGRLSATGRSDKGDERCRLDREAHVLQRLHRYFSNLIRLTDLFRYN